MAKTKGASSNEAPVRLRKARTLEARENQLASLAMDVAEQQLLDGTASPSVITHFLKLSSTKEKLEKEILKTQKELMEAKTENLKSTKRIEELYSNAMDAMRVYSGHGASND